VELAAELGLEPVVSAGGIPTVRNPIRLSATPARYDLAPPALNEHEDAIRAWLGVADDRATHHDRTDPPVPSP
jgi:crotonobetainyl-CoA:carnitine CoA-transferase CaiB-like acyl-CoA transferase